MDKNSFQLPETFSYANDVKEREKLKRTVQAVLNKLTFQKLKILLEQLHKLIIVTEEEINLVVDLVYEHAVYEPRFSIVYASLCKSLDLKISSANDQHIEEIKFSSLLITKCQNEFESGFKDCLEDRDNDQISPNQLEKDKKKAKCNRLGNIRFIGELFKVGMVSSSVLEENIKSLLKQEDEIALECFFWLIKTVGKHLKTLISQEENPIDAYFEKIQQIVTERSTSSRIRFLLQDNIDLKENNWVPRRPEDIPRTIDEIHKEAAVEAFEKIKQCRKKRHNPKNSSKLSTNACVCKKKSSLPKRNRKGVLSSVESLESNSEPISESKDTSTDEVEKKQTNKVEDSVGNCSRDDELELPLD